LNIDERFTAQQTGRAGAEAGKFAPAATFRSSFPTPLPQQPDNTRRSTRACWIPDEWRDALSRCLLPPDALPLTLRDDR